MQFLETAYNLQVHIIKMCVKFPKRYTFFVTNNIVDLATKCHMNVKSANTIYPQNEHELQLRKDYINAAICDLQNLISQLDIAKGLLKSMYRCNLGGGTPRSIRATGQLREWMGL